MTDAILVVNAGSSSIKCALHAGDTPERCLGRAQIERIGGEATWRTSHRPPAPVPAEAGSTHAAHLARLLGRIEREFPEAAVVAAGHRVVHGGRDFAAPARFSGEVRDRLQRLIPLAPAHQPHNLAGIEALEAERPDLPQVACFDTTFHRTQPRLAQLFALPRALSEEGIPRYGFHGLSYEHIAAVLPEHLGSRAEGRVIVSHLGHGASMCATHRRESVATSMGFAALDGLMMGKRCGAIDPGVLLHLMRDRGMSVAEVEDLLGRRSGLLGVSGISDDMRDLLASDAPEDAEAVALFVYRAVREVDALAAALGGLDAIVFTAGIGEHCPDIRLRILEGCAWLGASIDAVANKGGGPLISTRESAVTALVIPTDEEHVIAHHTAAILRSS